jgi:hypothetical protein
MKHIFFLLPLLCLGAASAHAQVLSLHTTQPEKNIMRQRAGLTAAPSGPYKNEYDLIKAKAEAFKTSPTPNWAGNTCSGNPWDGKCAWVQRAPGEARQQSCVGCPSCLASGDCTDCQENNNHPSRRYAEKVRDAAFYYLLTGDTTYRDPVRKHLIDQTTVAGTNFANTTRWHPDYCGRDADHDIVIWLSELTYAYSYIRNSLSTGDKTTLDTWFTNAGAYWEKVAHNNCKMRFPNRKSATNPYGSPFGTPSGSGAYDTQQLTHYQGYQTHKLSAPWDNNNSLRMAAVCAIAVVVNNATTATLKTECTRFVKEWLYFAVYPDGTVWDQRRAIEAGSGPQGWSYAMTSISSIITIVDHLARAGDTALYTFSTSLGAPAPFNTAGGPKSLRKVLQTIANRTLLNQTVYGSTTQTTNECLRIDPDTASGCGATTYRATYVALAQANVFYKDTLLKSAYQRATNYTGGGAYNEFGGDWGRGPGMRFQFGLLENEASVNPYGGRSRPPSR